ncbi:hypothetical protein Pfo_019036 [Paulownia fortunei]|nr:hypothetical protein Pfo_019036 [Paulownia fortunei]
MANHHITAEIRSESKIVHLEKKVGNLIEEYEIQVVRFDCKIATCHVSVKIVMLLDLRVPDTKKGAIVDDGVVGATGDGAVETAGDGAIETVGDGATGRSPINIPYAEVNSSQGMNLLEQLLLQSDTELEVLH